MGEPHQSVQDYYPHAIGFHKKFLRTPAQQQAAVLVPAPSGVPSVAATHNDDTIEPNEVCTGSLVSKPSASLTVSALLFPSSPPVQVTPEAITMVFDELMKVRASVGIFEPTGIVEGLHAAKSCTGRASRYHFLVHRKKQVKETLGNILEDQAMVLSERVTTDQDNRFGLNLSDTYSCAIASSQAFQSPDCKHASKRSPSQPAALIF